MCAKETSLVTEAPKTPEPHQPNTTEEQLKAKYLTGKEVSAWGCWGMITGVILLVVAFIVWANSGNKEVFILPALVFVPSLIAYAWGQVFQDHFRKL